MHTQDVNSATLVWALGFKSISHHVFLFLLCKSLLADVMLQVAPKQSQVQIEKIELSFVSVIGKLTQLLNFSSSILFFNNCF